MAACKDCGKQLGAFEKKYPVKEAGVSGVICAACRQKPRLCSGCGAQIDRLAKHRVFKDGTFLCNACYEERKKKQAQKQVQVTQPEQQFTAGYKGGFAGYAKQQVLTFRIGATQVSVEQVGLSGFGKRKLLWTMPYDKIKEIRIDTAEKITATRLLLTGVFAFALKKKQHYLVISFEDEHGMMQNPVFEGILINKILEAVYPQVGAARTRTPLVEQQPQQPQAAPQQPQQATIDAAEQIKKLGELRDQGLLTEQEFDSKKQELLARM
jgi:hypothetical protein